MDARTILQKLMSLSLCLVLISCSATRPTLASPSGPQDLAEYVLIIQEKPDGQPTHEWRDCEDELHVCYQDCMRRPLPPGYGGIKIPRKAGGKAEWCNRKCIQPYNDCCRLRELEAQRFEAIEPAVDWAKKNRKEILTGTMVIIAGVAFLAFGGPGILILAPAAAVLLTNEIEIAPPEAPNQERF